MNDDHKLTHAHLDWEHLDSRYDHEAGLILFR